MLNREIENIFEEEMNLRLGTLDLAHDIGHVKRVVENARLISNELKANWNIVGPAAWLHDFVNLPKDHPDRAKASLLSADEAVNFLKKINYPEMFLAGIHHAILAHSFSANIKPMTIEAEIVQDADRLDALGAIGIYRLLTVSSSMKSDLKSAIFHVEEKLRPITFMMNTAYGKSEALKRLNVIEDFIRQLKQEKVEL